MEVTMASVDLTRIAGNIAALNALNSLTNINSQLALHQQRLSTGKQLNNAADDPSAANIATTFMVRDQGMQTALGAIGDAQNLFNNMEGGLQKVQDILVQMRNKALQAKGDTLGTNERAAITSQLKSFRDEINDVVAQTQWNGNALLGATSGGTSGSVGGATSATNFLTDAAGGTTSFSFAADGNSGIAANQGFAAAASGSMGLGLSDASLSITDSASAGTALTAIDASLNIVKAAISQEGAFSARLTFKLQGLAVQDANTQAAYNRIANANMAQEQVDASKLTILQQTSNAMLAQANSAPQYLLKLFQ
jgi:flagellin